MSANRSQRQVRKAILDAPAAAAQEIQATPAVQGPGSRRRTVGRSRGFREGVRV